MFNLCNIWDLDILKKLLHETYTKYSLLIQNKLEGNYAYHYTTKAVLFETN